MFTRSNRVFLYLIAACIAAVFSANAQFVRGSIVGRVTDQSEGVIAGAEVKLQNQGTNETKQANTDNEGNFSFPALLPGVYRVEASREGFKTQVVNDIRLEVNQTARIDMKLDVGELVQRVESVASLQFLKTDATDVGSVIANKQIVELPLNGRDYLQLARLIPGAIPSRAGATAGQKGVNRSVNVAGARDTSVAFLLDGVDTNDIVFQTPTVTPSVDAIQEFKLVGDTYSAEFGRGSTQIITALKSGTNDVHSTLLYFNRNNSFAARNFFQLGSVARLNFTQFGGTLGGPVTLPKVYSGRDKTFFFMNYEGGRTRSGGTNYAYVPWAELRAGDFSAAGNPTIYDPDTFDAATRIRQPFGQNKIPSTRISSVANKILSFYPSPNYSGQTGRNYVASIPGVDDTNNANARIDHRFSAKDNVFGRYSILDRNRPLPGTLAYSGITDTIRGQNVALNWIHIFTPTLLNEARAGFNRSKYYTTAISSPSANPAKDLFGFKNTIDDPTVGYGLPLFGLSGGFSGLGPGSQYPANSVVQSYQYLDNVTWVRGPHTIKSGFDFRRTRMTAVVGNSARGYALFTGQFTNLPSQSSTTGSSIADLLLGLPQTVQSSVGDGIAHDYTNLYGIYFQDDWKVTSRLTLNLGIRYEYASPYVEKLDRFSIIDFDNRATGGRLLLANSTKVFVPGKGVVDVGGSPTSRSLIPPDRNNVAPRVGIAYRPMAKTVVRAGAGMFYDVQEGNEAQFLRNNPPYLFAQNLASDTFVPTFRLDNLFPSPNQPTGAIQPFSEDITNRTPYLVQWSMAVEREVMDNLTVEAGYVGSAGKKLLRRSNFQQGANILVKDPANPTPLVQRVDFPNFSNNNILSTDNGGSSTYHGLLTKVERRFSSGFALLFSYTFSKAISDSHSSSNFDNTPSNPQCRCNLRAEKSPAAFDIKHRAVFSYSYNLPLGKGRRFLNTGGVVNKLAGGWQVNGITAMQSGPPFTLATSGDNASIGSSNQRPNLAGDPYAGIDTSAPMQRRGVDQGTTYFNKSAFVLPPLFTLGNVGKNSLYGPGMMNWDFSVFKNTGITERINTQFRAEFFNIFNHPNFGLPNRTINQPTTGMMTSAMSPRIVQFGMKLIF